MNVFLERVEHCEACGELTPHREGMSIAKLIRADESRGRWCCCRCAWKRVVAKRKPPKDGFLHLVMSRNPIDWF